MSHENYSFHPEREEEYLKDAEDILRSHDEGVKIYNEGLDRQAAVGAPDLIAGLEQDLKQANVGDAAEAYAHNMDALGEDPTIGNEAEDFLRDQEMQAKVDSTNKMAEHIRSMNGPLDYSDIKARQERNASQDKPPTEAELRILEEGLTPDQKQKSKSFPTPNDGKQ